jgi:dipeptidyl-peptidase-4
MRDTLMPAVSGILTQKYNVLNCFYGEFTDQKNPENGWISYASEPRYLTNYIGVRNRLAILNENYVYADYKSRVLGSYSLLHSILEYASAHAGNIKTMLHTIDMQTVARGMEPAVQDSFPIEYSARPTPKSILVKAIEVDIEKDADGHEQLKQSNRKRTVNAPYIADYYATKNISLPFAYLLKVNDPAIIGLLAAHGIKLEKTTKHYMLVVQSFKIESLKPASRLNQGHYNDAVTGSIIKDTVEFPAGTYVVRMAQPLANLAAYLLEPQSNDALLYWNFFDRYLVPQWGKGFNEYPVYRLTNKAELQTSPVKQE